MMFEISASTSRRGLSRRIPRGVAVVAVFAISVAGLGAVATPASATPPTATVTISNIPAINGVVGATFTPTYSGTATGTTYVTSSTASVCTVASGVVSFLTAGTCTLTATAISSQTGSPQSITVAAQKIFNGPSGVINAQATDANGVTYLGGNFSSYGPQTGGGAVVADPASTPVDPPNASAQHVQLDVTMPTVTGEVDASASDGTGGWFIGGNFTLVGGIARNNLAHILSDGSVDGSWNPNANDAVNALVVSGTTLIVGGRFTKIGSATRNRLAAIGIDGTATSWNPNANGDVFALALVGSTLYVGGAFTTLGSATRNRLAIISITGTGTPSSWDPNLDGQVNAIAVTGGSSPIMYVGGLFTTVGSSTRNGLAAFTIVDGALSTTFAPSVTGGFVDAIGATPDPAGNIVIGGDFTSVDDIPDTGFEQIIGADGSITSFGGYTTPVRAITIANGSIYSVRNSPADDHKFLRVGNFGSPTPDYTTTPNEAATDLEWTGDVRTISVAGGKVYLGGSGSVGTPRDNLAAVASDGSLTSWAPYTDSNVSAIAVSGPTVFYGGDFATSTGSNGGYLGAVDNLGQAISGWANPTPDSSVRSLVVSGDGATLYVGGEFSNISDGTNTSGAGLTAVNTVNGSLTGWDTNANSTVWALAVDGSTVYAGGTFTNIGGASRNNLAAIDSSGTATPWNPLAGGAVRALAIDGSTVYAGGEFITMGGAPRSRLAAIGTNGTLSTTWNPGASGTTYAIAVSGSNVYVGGGFTTIGTTTRNNIAKIGTNGTLDTLWDPNANASVNTLAVAASTVAIGGSFATLGCFATAPGNFAQVSATATCLPVATATISNLPTTSRSAGGTYTPTVTTNGNGVTSVTSSTTSICTATSGVVTFLAAGTCTLVAHAAATSAWRAGDGVAQSITVVIPSAAISNLPDIRGFVGGAFQPIVGAGDVENATVTSSTQSVCTVSGGLVNYIAVGTCTITGHVTYGLAPTTVDGSPQTIAVAIQRIAYKPMIFGTTGLTSAKVSAIAKDANANTYLGGEFGGLGASTIGFIGAQSGKLDQTFTGTTRNGTLGIVSIGDGSGGVYVGGTNLAKKRYGLLHILADGSIDPAFHPCTEGNPSALALSGSNLLVGGLFVSVYRSCNTGSTTVRSTTMTLDVADSSLQVGDSVTSANVPSGTTVTAISGRALTLSAAATGTSSQIAYFGRAARNYLAAFKTTDGSLTTWDPNLTYSGSISPSVDSLVVSGSTVYVGGRFDTVGATNTRNNLAAFSIDGTTGLPSSTPTSWNPNVGPVTAFAKVNTLAVSGSTVFVGGIFETVGSTTRKGLAAIGTDGTLASWNPNVGGSLPSVSALAISGSTVFIGGKFTTIGSTPRQNLAAIGTDGTLTSWNPSANGAVSTLAVSGSTVYVGGSFMGLGASTTSNGTAAAGSTTLTLGVANPSIQVGMSVENGGAPSFANGTTVTAVSGKVITLSAPMFSLISNTATITFSTYGRMRLAAIGTDGVVTSWNPGTFTNSSNSVFGITPIGSSVFVTGSVLLGYGLRSKLAAFAPDGSLLPWNPSVNAAVNALAVDGSSVYVGGLFTSVSGAARNYAAAVGTNGTITSWNPNASGTVFALAISDSTVYLGGAFSSIGGTNRQRLAAVGTDGTLRSWNPVANAQVNALAISGSTVYAGGAFTSVAGSTRNGVAAIGIDGTLSTTWDPNVQRSANSQAVSALTISGSTVFIGGFFTSVRSNARNNLAAVGTDGSLSTWDPNVGGGSAVITSLAASGSTVYAGGSFTTIGGSPRNNLAAIGSDGTLASWNPNPNDGVLALALSGSTLNVGGNFSSVAAPNDYKAYFAALSTRTSLTVTAATPASIDSATAVPSVGYTTSPSTVTGDWDTEPMCAVYATSDTAYATPLSGSQAAGAYVTHCSGGTEKYSSMTASNNYDSWNFVDGSLTVTQYVAPKTSVTVTASSPASIKAGTSIPAITYTTSPSTVAGDWTVQPTCAVYASSDTGYATALSGAAVAAGTYVTHCSGGSSASYNPTSYVNGSLTVTPATTNVTVTAATSSITYGASMPSVGYTTSPSTVAGDWTSEPSCAVYSTSDTGFASPLSGQHSAGTYVTHCAGGTSTSYTPTSYVDGVLTISKAASSTVITCPTVHVTYTGSAQTPCSAVVTGAGGLSTTATLAYGSNTNAGTATANASYVGDANHNGSAATQSTFVIDQAASVATVVCSPKTTTYSGSVQTMCSAAVTGAGGLNLTGLTPSYTSNTNVGTSTATYSFVGDANHSASQGSDTFSINPATVVVTAASSSITYGASIPSVSYTTSPSTVAGDWTSEPSCSVYSTSDTTFASPLSGVHSAGSYVTHCSNGSSSNYTTTVVVDGSLTIYTAASTTVITCPASITYSGSYQEPCTAAVTGVGDLSTTATVTYANNRDAGAGLADSTYAGDANHKGSTASQSSFTIDKASTSTVITCPTAHEIFDGNEHYPCTAAVTGAGLTTTTSVIYASNFDAGNATADASYDGDNNYLSSTATQSGFVIDKTTSTTAVTCSLPSVTYNGSAQTPCTATVVGAGGLGQSIDVLYSPNTDAGSVSATANYVGDPNHYSSSDQSGFTIVPATSTTTVTCSVSSTPYNGSEQTPCTAQVTGDGGLSQSLDVQYSPNTDAGSVSASANYPGDPNHDNSSDSSGFAIDAVTSTTTVTCSVSSVTYDGSIQTPCSASVSGAGGLSQSLDVQYSPNTDAGSVSASANYPGDPNHYSSSDQSGFMIDQATSMTTVSCSVSSVTYDGNAQTPCSASVSGAGGLSQGLDVMYSPNTDAGSVSASASFQGDPNHSPSSDLSGFGIEQASSTTTVTCPTAHETYDGSARTPCSASVTGAGGLSQPVDVMYAANTDAGIAHADAQYDGDPNHTVSQDASSFVIDRASSSTTVTCSPKSTTYSGIAQALCSASVTGAGGLNLTGLTPSYLANTNAGTATASYVFAGDANHTGSDGSDTFSINPATVVVTSSSLTITYGAVVPAISYATSPVTVAGDWTTEPACAVYATVDTTFTTSLTGVLGAGSYVTHCSNGVSSNYTTISSVDGTLTVDKANTTTVVTCSSSPVTYDGSAQTPCSAAVTGAGGLSTTVSVSYLANANAGTATADATYVGDANHTGSTATQVSFTIAKAVSSTVIMCAASYVYTGSAIENCAAAVTGAGGLSTSVTPTYSTDHTNVGSVTVNASYAGDANHTGSSATQVSFAITKAASSTVITCSASSFVYTGLAQTPCGSAVVTGAGGLSTTATVIYASNTNVGTATANASYAGDANHTGSTATQQTFAITKASVVVNAPIVNITYNTAIPPVGFSTTPATVMADWTSVPTCAVYAPLGVVALTGVQPAGTYETRCSGGVSANYSISSYVKGSLTIAQAPTVTTITCTTPTYTGVALTPCTASVTGSGLTTITGVPTYTNNINAGVNTASATYSYAGTANYLPSTATVNFTINKATSTVTVTCSVTTAVYTGVAITPCGTTAAVTGVGGLSTTTPIVYTNNLTVTTADKLATATGTYAGDANHATATASKTYTITKAPATATITCTGTTFVYTAAAITPCSASVTSVGVALTATPTYTANTNVGTATAAYTYAGDTNHASVVATAKTFTITKASSVTKVTCPTTTSTYTGAAITPCTATLTGPGLTAAITPTYVNNTNPGTATASYAYAGTTNVNASSASATFTIVAITPTIVYTGTQIANSASTSTLTLSSTTSSTLCTGALSYSLDRNPITGAAGAFLLSATPVNTFGWLDGVYVITSARAASTGCSAVSDNQSVVTIANTTSRAYGGGKYTVTGQPSVSAGWFITAGTTTAATGQFQFIENNTWKYIGNLTTYTKTGTTGVSTGTGTLSYWNTTTKTWVSVGSAIPVSITYTNGANGTLATTFTYTPKTGEPALPTTAAQKIGTTIKVG